MKKLIYITMALALMLAGVTFATAGGIQAAAAEKPAVFLNLTSGQEDLHAVSMGLGLALSSLEHGHEVVIFLNVHAPVIASASLGDDVKIADFPPVKELLARAIAQGATVLVCGHCTEVCGVAKDSLIDGVKVSQHGDVLTHLKPGMVSFSY